MSATTVTDVLEQIGRLNRALVKGEARWRLLVGARGVGKTTCICKWLARDVLKEGRQVEVMRLGTTRGDELDLLCESLDVRVAQASCPRSAATGGFIDAPGVDYTNPGAVQQLSDHLNYALRITNYDSYLVLNAAYHPDVLHKQVRAFSVLNLKGLIFTHVEECVGDAWKALARETHHRIAYVSAGAEIPGVWEPCSPLPPILFPTSSGSGAPAPLSETLSSAATSIPLTNGRSFAENKRHL